MPHSSHSRTWRRRELHQSDEKMNSITSIPPFSTIDADPGGTLKKFDDYIKQMKLLFTLVFRKSDGTAYNPTDAENKANDTLRPCEKHGRC